MENFSTILLILVRFVFVLGSSPNNQCGTDDKCVCLWLLEKYEFQCPKSNYSVVIHTKPEAYMEVQCSSLDRFDLEIFPNYSAGNVETLTIKYCPLPENGLQPFLQKFGIETVTSFGIEDASSEYSSNKKLTNDFFRNMSSLQHLRINLGNTTFDNDFLEYLPNLTRLDLDGSNLKEIGNIFKYTPQLVQLYLSRISIKEIPDGLFANLAHLQILHLWQNQLTALTKAHFVGLTNLRSLELSSNRISHIDPGSFSELPMLVSISLRKNNLGHVSSGLFGNDSKLEQIQIDSNTNLTLAERCFAYLNRLATLHMENSGLEVIPENAFEGSANIEVLLLGKNRLEKLPIGLFKGLRKLKQLNLSWNKINSLGDGIFSDTDSLEELHLEHNLLTAIDENTFDMKNLKKLVLNHNQLSTITLNTFHGLHGLISLDLSDNTINFNPEYSPFSKCEYLEELNLMGNQLSSFPYTILYMVHLKSLNLSRNQISEIYVNSMMALSRLNIDLTYNNITFLDFDGISNIENQTDEDRSLTEVDLANNKLICDCRNFGLIQYLDGVFPRVRTDLELKLGNSHCAGPKPFQHIQIVELKPKHISCTYLKKGCPKECQCFYRPFDETVVIDCAHRNLTYWPKIGFNAEKIELNLVGNILTHSPNASRQYNNITNLYLSNNRIRKMNWVPSKIQILQLDGNNLTHISSSLLDQLSNSSTLSNITLSGNPWTCDCDATLLQNFVKANSSTVYGWTDMLCQEDNMPLVNKKVLCLPPIHILQILLPVVLLLFVMVALIAIYAFYREEVRIWLYLHDWCLPCIIPDDLDKDKLYDVFISYSHKDEDFVMQNILPVLEGAPNGFKVCIHVRDFLPGAFIATQVSESVLNSRRTLVVLSNNFLESVWGKLEFRLAHTQAIEEGRARVVAIKLGELDEEKLDEDLRMYLKTNTYVEWGKPWFWKKLRYALPHDRRNGGEQAVLDQRHANMMLKIDDKFALNLPPLSHSESTPPVLGVDPPLIKNRLNLEKDSNQTPPAEAPTIIV